MKRLGIREIYSNDKDFDVFPWLKRIFQNFFHLNFLRSNSTSWDMALEVSLSK
jgi:hypothetical protein